MARPSSYPLELRKRAEESAAMKALKKENAELRPANDILKAAVSFFAAELDRPHTRS